ncbi:MAG: hypothetical protein SFY92_09770, partial [Verrucomicrobiae bacterium]|nr:hypothetical protein [Verrucomicrobiae bacterium]
KYWGVRAALLLLALLIAFALWHGIENWRGHRAWEAAKDRLRAGGINLDIRDYYLPPIPDEENFAKTESFEKYFSSSQRLSQMADPRQFKNPFDWGSNGHPLWPKIELGQRADLTPISDSYATNSPAIASLKTTGERVLAGMAPTDQAVNTLLRDLKKTQCHTGYLENHHGPFLNMQIPSFLNLRVACQNLNIRALALFSLNRNKEGFDLVMKSFDLADTLKNEPTLVACMIRVGIISLNLSTVWEAITDEKLSSQQLLTLQNRLSKIHLDRDVTRSFKMETFYTVKIVEHFDETYFKEKFPFISPPHSGNSPGLKGVLENTIETAEHLLQKTVYELIPRGWHLQSAAKNISLTHPPVIYSGADRPELFSNLKVLDKELHSPKRIFLAGDILLIGAPNYARAAILALRTQTYVRSAELACALERYRLQYKTYPNSLAALVPQFIESLPLDPVDGKPLRYKWLSKDSYLLYSLGYNMADDGGTRSAKPDDPFAPNGDWVWSIR